MPPPLVTRLLRLYPFYRGRGRIALSRLFRERQPEIADTTLASGERIRVPAEDYIGRMIVFFGDLDPAVTNVVRRCLGPGDIVIDVGANVGAISLMAASRVGSTGRVIAFEPQRELALLLGESARLNRLDNLEVHPIALWDSSTWGEMRFRAENRGNGRVEEAAGDYRLVRLDDLDVLNRFDRIRLLKIDVEGAEARVLAGGARFLEQRRPELVVFESHASLGPFWRRPDVAILSSLGYRFFEIIRRVGGARLRAIPRIDDRVPEGYDFLAARQDAPLEAH